VPGAHSEPPRGSYLEAPVAKERVRWPRTQVQEWRRGSMLAAIGGGGIVGILVIVLIVMAIIYFVRRS
jgi:hypothetical protein